MWKRFVHDYLSYTSKERTGIFILIGLIIICFFIPFLYPYLHQETNFDKNKFHNEISQLKLRQTDSSLSKNASRNLNEDFNDYAQPSEKYYSKAKAEVFDFDPNTATAAEWKRLGVKERTVETIQKYISKGGHFYKSEDIKKIWGLRVEDVQRLLPYVKIKSEPKNTRYVPVKQESNRMSYVSKTPTSIDINSADTSAFIALPGIGSKLAQRIVNFRDKLGGFYSVDQVSETFGLPDSTFQKLKSRLSLSNPTVRKININTASLNELKVHPYIRFNLANAIIEFRKQHGNFSSVADLKKIMAITEESYNKIESYLTVE